MGALGAFVILLVLFAAFGLYVAVYAARRKFKEAFPTGAEKDKVQLLHQGLKTVKFWDETDHPTDRVYIRNKFLTGLIEDIVKDGNFGLYVRRADLMVVNNNKKEILYDWLLCSPTHCIGFNLPPNVTKF